VTECSCPHLPKAVLFGDVFGFEDDVFQLGCFFATKALRHKVILFFVTLLLRCVFFWTRPSTALRVTVTDSLKRSHGSKRIFFQTIKAIKVRG
jgi:hypothetical protein